MTTPDYRPFAYLIILLGAAAAGVAGVLPHYSAGYRLDALALLAVLTPFILYASLTESLRGGWLLASGLALLFVCLAVVVSERFLGYDAYADGSLYWVPPLAAAIVLPVAYALGGRPPEAEGVTAD